MLRFCRIWHEDVQNNPVKVRQGVIRKRKFTNFRTPKIRISGQNWTYSWKSGTHRDVGRSVLTLKRSFSWLLMFKPLNLFLFLLAALPSVSHYVLYVLGTEYKDLILKGFKAQNSQMHLKRMVQCTHVGSAWRNQQGLMKGVTLKEDLGNSENITNCAKMGEGVRRDFSKRRKYCAKICLFERPYCGWAELSISEGQLCRNKKGLVYCLLSAIAQILDILATLIFQFCLTVKSVYQGSLMAPSLAKRSGEGTWDELRQAKWGAWDSTQFCPMGENSFLWPSI